MLTFELLNEKKYPLNLPLLKKAVVVFNQTAKLKNQASFSLAVIDSRAMRKWNRIYRGRDCRTDVLSFSQLDAEKIMPAEKGDLGEILICWPAVKSQAKDYGFTLEFELVRLLIHGLAHLIGYDHEGVSKLKADRMRKFEDQIMKKIFPE